MANWSASSLTTDRHIMNRTTLSEETWNKLKPLLPGNPGNRGRPFKNHRPVLEGILWVLRTGAPWRDLPRYFCAWNTAYTRFRRWTLDSTWTNLWEVLKDEVDAENFSVDGSNVKVHQDACRIKKRRNRRLGDQWVESLQRSMR